jgi:glycosyltransferase involved in cell wall biosynthesis
MLRLAAALRRAGHEPLPQWFDHRFELMPWRLGRVPAPEGIDLVHAGSWQGFAFKRVGVPLVVTEHQYVAHPAFIAQRGRLQAIYHQAFVGPCMRRSYLVANALVAVSRHVAEAMEVDIGRKVDIIPNWVDCRHFAPGTIQRSGRRPFRLLFVGNPSRWKGADVLPRLARKLGSGFEIGCLGGLRRGFDTTGLPPNMRPLPRTEPKDMPTLYRSFDAALLPTRYEAFGYVALEAMACGLPVLGFASTGTAEVAVHGETALLAPMDDMDRLVEYARVLARTPDLCQRLGSAGRKRAVACFDESAAIDAYLALYDRVLMRATWS